MATAVLDYSILGQFTNILLWLLFFLLSYGLLKLADPLKLKDDDGLYGPIALITSIILAISDVFVTMITYALPWFAVVIMVAFLMLFFAKMFNPDLEAKKVLGDGTVKGISISLLVIILLFALGATIGPDVQQVRSGVDNSQLSEADIATGETIPENTFVPADQAGGTLSAATNDRQTNVINTIFHPNVLGMVFLLLIAMTALYLITKPMSAE